MVESQIRYVDSPFSVKHALPSVLTSVSMVQVVLLEQEESSEHVLRFNSVEVPSAMQVPETYASRYDEYVHSAEAT